MADVVFPAKVKITVDTDVDGFEQTEATIEVADQHAQLELPEGPEGDKGPRGVPRATWIKSGTVTNPSQLPSDLTADDAGKWWHDTTTNDMWTWNGTEWKQSVDAVGDIGPVGPANTLDVVKVNRDPNITIAGMKLGGYGANQTAEVTIPAGMKGDKGDPGESGVVRQAPDFDPVKGAVHRSVFAWNRGPRKWRPMPFPNGYGPWAISNTSFMATKNDITAKETTIAEITIPALPFAWRPYCYGTVVLNKATKNSWPHVWVRINTAGSGVNVAHAVHPFRTNFNFLTTIFPAFMDGKVSPTSTFGVVPPSQETTLYVVLEKQGNEDGTVGFENGASSLCVYAMPV